MRTEREALLKVLAEQGLSEPGYSPHGWRCDNPDRYPDYCTCARDTADAILTAGFRRQWPITDAQVQVARETLYRAENHYPAIDAMRAVLEAAWEVGS